MGPLTKVRLKTVRQLRDEKICHNHLRYLTQLTHHSVCVCVCVRVLATTSNLDDLAISVKLFRVFFFTNKGWKKLFFFYRNFFVLFHVSKSWYKRSKTKNIMNNSHVVHASSGAFEGMKNFLRQNKCVELLDFSLFVRYDS